MAAVVVSGLVPPTVLALTHSSAGTIHPLARSALWKGCHLWYQVSWLLQEVQEISCEEYWNSGDQSTDGMTQRRALPDIFFRQPTNSHIHRQTGIRHRRWLLSCFPRRSHPKYADVFHSFHNLWQLAKQEVQPSHLLLTPHLYPPFRYPPVLNCWSLTLTWTSQYPHHSLTWMNLQPFLMAKIESQQLPMDRSRKSPVVAWRKGRVVWKG